MKPKKSKQDLMDETLVKLQARKLKTWSRIVADKDLQAAHRTILWFVLDCITLPDTALKYQLQKRVVIWPSQQGIADKAGVDRGMVKRAIEAAKRCGYLKQLSVGTGLSGNSEYRVMPLQPKAKA